VRDLGIKGVSDGLETDRQGRIYFGDEERALMRRGRPSGPYATIARVAPMYWLDTLSVATNGYLYFTANELQRQGRFHFGKDLRVKPYKLYRVKINAQPVLLR
jgi:sugar lactone lactonase YvrE